MARPALKSTRMSAHVLQIDLSKPLEPFKTDSRHAALWMVIRFGARPIGWLRWRRAVIGEVLTPDVLQGLIADQLGMQVIDLLRNPQLRAAPDISSYMPRISIVICTRECPEQLQRQLNS